MSDFLDGSPIVNAWIAKHRHCDIGGFAHDFDLEVATPEMRHLVCAYSLEQEESLLTAELERELRVEQRCLTESNFGSPTASMELERCEKPPGAASSKRGSTSRECCVSGDDLVLRGSWQGSEEDGTGYLLTMRLRVLKLRIDAGGSSEHEVGEQLSQVSEVWDPENLWFRERQKTKEKTINREGKDDSDAMQVDSDEVVVAPGSVDLGVQGHEQVVVGDLSENDLRLGAHYVAGTITWKLIQVRQTDNLRYVQQYRDFLESSCGNKAVERVKGMFRGGAFYLSGCRAVDPGLKQNDQNYSIINFDQYVLKWDAASGSFRGVTRNLHSCPDVRHWDALLLTQVIGTSALMRQLVPDLEGVLCEPCGVGKGKFRFSGSLASPGTNWGGGSNAAGAGPRRPMTEHWTKGAPGHVEDPANNERAPSGGNRGSAGERGGPGPQYAVPSSALPPAFPAFLPSPDRSPHWDPLSGSATSDGVVVSRANRMGSTALRGDLFRRLGRAPRGRQLLADQSFRRSGEERGHDVVRRIRGRGLLGTCTVGPRRGGA